MPRLPLADRARAESATAHRAVLVVFAVNGGMFATWASRIPDAKHALGLDARQLGLLLLCLSLGSVTGLPTSGWINDRLGTRRATAGSSVLALIGFVVATIGVSGFSSAPVTGVGLVVAGFGMGVWDMSMNLEGARVEQRLGRSTMPLYHAAFSAGTVTAALIGAGLSAWSVPAAWHVLAASSVASVALARCLRMFSSWRPERSSPTGAPSAARSSWLEPRTLAIGLVVLAAAFTEGTANDWLSVAVADGHDLPNWAGVLAFAVFLTSMTSGRLSGPVLLSRFGRVAVLRVMFVVALAGNLLVVFGPVWAAYVGAVLWGYGVSLGFPTGMSAAADDPVRAARRLAVVSTIGYAAFLAGPPLLGMLGQEVGVLHALTLVAAMVALALAVVSSVREPERT